MACGDLLYFVALSHIGSGRTVILTMITPVLTACFAWLSFGEQLSSNQWLGALLVVAGGVLAESRRLGSSQRTQADTIGVLAALGCATTFAISNVMTRGGVTHTGMVTSSAWRLAGGAVGLVLISFFRGEGFGVLKTPFQGATWKTFLIPSALGTWCGMAFLMGGLTWAKQGVAAAMAAATALFSLPLARVWLGEKAGLRGWLGAALVMTGVAVLGLAGV
jgi:drug/metabolite transporter (DMT)-like permease